MKPDIVAIDVHVHVWTEEVVRSLGAANQAGMSRHFRRDLGPVSLDELADYYRERRMMAVLLNIDDSTITGVPPPSNDMLAAACRKHSDVFRGLAGIDPAMGRLALDEARRAKEFLGLSGLKFNPGRQHFFPNDPRFYPLWELASELGLISLFHTGMMGNGAGMPGGLGFKLKYTAPIPNLDDIAADFPNLKIISAHPGFPWQDEQLALARHKGNVFIDLSGWAPRYFSPELVRQANSILADKCLFGSDWPVLAPDRWVAEFAELNISDENRHKIMLDNARRLFNIE